MIPAHNRRTGENKVSIARRGEVRRGERAGNKKSAAGTRSEEQKKKKKKKWKRREERKFE